MATADNGTSSFATSFRRRRAAFSRIIHDSRFDSRFTILDSRLLRSPMASPRDLFRRLTSGVYVITASHDGTSSGFTAAWLVQVSFEPLLVAVSINPGNATWQLIENSRGFVINVLDSNQQALARHFGLQSGRDVDKFAGVHTASRGGTRFLADAL